MTTEEDDAILVGRSPTTPEELRARFTSGFDRLKKQERALEELAMEHAKRTGTLPVKPVHAVESGGGREDFDESADGPEESVEEGKPKKKRLKKLTEVEGAEVIPAVKEAAFRKRLESFTYRGAQSNADLMQTLEDADDFEAVPDVLEKLAIEGGVDDLSGLLACIAFMNIVAGWLAEKSTRDQLASPLLRILDRIPSLPVADAKKWKLGQSVKKLEKSSDGTVRQLALRLVERWTDQKKDKEKPSTVRKQPQSQPTEPFRESPKLSRPSASASPATAPAEKPKKPSSGVVLLDAFGEELSRGKTTGPLASQAPRTAPQRPMTAEDIKRQKEMERWLRGPTEKTRKEPQAKVVAVTTAATVLPPASRSPPPPTAEPFVDDDDDDDDDEEEAPRESQEATAEEEATDVSGSYEQPTFEGSFSRTDSDLGTVEASSSTPVTDATRTKPKKRVSWPAEHKLVEIREYEKDDPEPADGEAVAAPQHLSGAEARRREIEMERAHMLEQKAASEEKWLQDKRNMTSTIPWKPPPIYEGAKLAPRGIESTEVEALKKRDAGRLAEHYFKPELIPETPREPEEPLAAFSDTEVPAFPWAEQPSRSPPKDLSKMLSTVAQFLKAGGLPLVQAQAQTQAQPPPPISASPLSVVSPTVPRLQSQPPVAQPQPQAPLPPQAPTMQAALPTAPTQLCSFWYQSGSCPRGGACPFLHNRLVAAPTQPQYGTQYSQVAPPPPIQYTQSPFTSQYAAPPPPPPPQQQQQQYSPLAQSASYVGGFGQAPQPQQPPTLSYSAPPVPYFQHRIPDQRQLPPGPPPSMAYGGAGQPSPYDMRPQWQPHPPPPQQQPSQQSIGPYAPQWR